MTLAVQNMIWLAVCAVMLATTLVVFIVQYRRRYGRNKHDD
jgi:heme/copper-type cytochrome/quinol oxidase subunit 2